MAEALTFREVGGEDIDELAELVADAFTDYRAFAAVGAEPAGGVRSLRLTM